MVFWTTLGALTPVAFILLLGYLAGRHGEFDQDQVAGLNDLALNYALPANLLISMATIKRSALLSEVPLLIILVIVMGGGFLLALTIASVVAHQNRVNSVLMALCAVNAAIPVYGIAVLSQLFPKQGAALVPLAALVVNIVQVPVALALLDSAPHAESGASHDNQADSGNSGDAGSSGDSGGSGGTTTKTKPEAKTQTQTQTKKKSKASSVVSVIVSTLKKPLVWAPLAGTIYALLALPVPAVAKQSLTLLGEATSGVAIFAAGIILVANPPRFSRMVGLLMGVRCIVLPAVVYGLVLVFGISGPLAQQTVVGFTLPMGVLTVQLALRYKSFTQQSATILFFSTVATFVLLPVVYLLTS